MLAWVSGAQGSSGSHEAKAVLNTAFIVPTQIKVFHDPVGFYVIGASIAGKTGSGHQFFPRLLIQNGINKGRFCVRVIESLTDNFTAFKKYEGRFGL